MKGAVTTTYKKRSRPSNVEAASGQEVPEKGSGAGPSDDEVATFMGESRKKVKSKAENEKGASSSAELESSPDRVARRISKMKVPVRAVEAVESLPTIMESPTRQGESVAQTSSNKMNPSNETHLSCGEQSKPTATVTYSRSRSFQQSYVDDYCAGAGNRDQGLESSDDETERRDLKTLHELRVSGEAKRFADEIEYIVDGLRPDQPVNIRRASYMDLATKLINNQNIRAFDVCGMLSRYLPFEDDEDRRSAKSIVALKETGEFLKKSLFYTIAPTSGHSRKYRKKLTEDIKGILQRAKLANVEQCSVTVTSLTILSIASIISLPHVEQSDGDSFIRFLFDPQISAKIIEFLGQFSAGDHPPQECSECLIIVQALRTTEVFHVALNDNPQFHDYLLALVDKNLELQEASSEWRLVDPRMMILTLKLLVDLSADSLESCRMFLDRQCLSYIIRLVAFCQADQIKFVKDEDEATNFEDDVLLLTLAWIKFVTTQIANVLPGLGGARA
ncbi:hypothetical protein HDU76_002659 [Blyttiomyces sp. JEL0837]|nr:hypothetical protein HDU76_002659 [Blyttiomyces sp. JEL0837]